MTTYQREIDLFTEFSPDHDLIREAISYIESHARNGGEAFTSPRATANYLQLQLATAERELFAALFLDTRHRLIEFQVLFAGTVDAAHVHPREVAKAALKVNAAAVIVAHNHPSGNPEPSQADLAITRRLRDALALLDIRLLDHFIVAPDSTVSLAERGLV
jgi:DNA repair protein RadC